ncbi:hypothetical protein BsWGS_24777 [Bradybaena similaris]
MAAIDAEAYGEETSDRSFNESHCESAQEKARPDTEDNVNGQSMHKNYTIPAAFPLPKTSKQPSRDATKDIETSCDVGNDQSGTGTINLVVFFQAISLVCSLPMNIVSKIADNLSRNGKPINNTILTEECILYEEVHGLFVADYKEGDECLEIGGAVGVSVSNTAILTTDFQSLPSSAHALQHSSLASKYHQHLSSTTQQSLSTYSDNSNSDGRQRASCSEKPLLSSPIVNQDYNFSVSTQSGLNNMAEDVGEDSVDGHSLESHDGLDSWVGSGPSNNFVQASDSNLENMGSPMLSHTLYGSRHNMSVSKSGQSMLFDELSNDKSSETSLNTSEQVPRVKDFNYIVCDGADNAITREIIEPQKLRGAEITPGKKSSSLSGAEITRISVSLLEKEHELLENSRLCHSCHEKPREVTFLPCGHFINCVNCAEPIYTCPLCEKSILATVNTYLS